MLGALLPEYAIYKPIWWVPKSQFTTIFPPGIWNCKFRLWATGRESPTSQVPVNQRRKFPHCVLERFLVNFANTTIGIHPRWPGAFTLYNYPWVGFGAKKPTNRSTARHARGISKSKNRAWNNRFHTRAFGCDLYAPAGRRRVNLGLLVELFQFYALVTENSRRKCSNRGIAVCELLPKLSSSWLCQARR